VTVATFRPAEWWEGAVRLLAAHLKDGCGPLYVGEGLPVAVARAARRRAGCNVALVGPEAATVARAVIEARLGLPSGVLDEGGFAFVLAPGRANRAALLELVRRPPPWSVVVVADQDAVP
jgi:hypothetical protein